MVLSPDLGNARQQDVLEGFEAVMHHGELSDILELYRLSAAVPPESESRTVNIHEYLPQELGFHFRGFRPLAPQVLVCSAHRDVVGCGPDHLLQDWIPSASVTSETGEKASGFA